MSLETRTSDGWATTRFVVLGFGTAGYACADSLIAVETPLDWPWNGSLARGF